MNTAIGPQDEALRHRMVDDLLRDGPLPGRVEQVLRAVPRHRFVPDAPVADAYADQAVITKRAADGAPLSCASAPHVVAMMLTQLDVQPGQRILEIGAGTGYNAALLADLTGPHGNVTTIDIDPTVTAAAGAGAELDATGHRQVDVVTGDGADGHPSAAPYDRIILTVASWDLPPAWWQQLTPGGRLVVPLRWRGQTRSIAFLHQRHLLRSDSVRVCGFVPLAGQDAERTTALDPDAQVALTFDPDQPINPQALHGVLDQPKTTAWTTATIGPYDPVDGVWLRLTATHPGTCRISATRTAVQTGLCTPTIPSLSPALVDGHSLAYFSQRPIGQPAERRWELGAIGYGPAGRALADHLCGQIRAWDHDRAAQPVITAYPTTTGAGDVDNRHSIVKQHSCLAMTW